ncbi:Small-conductance mechanosensitive channel (MscS) (PDB:2OAU) [Commensalibacter communis]|uniref:mechanosensitive ion channel family protein n=1 Tax=Commensalibacter communis TaxID=2972786 RepID=UPI0022FF4FFB|nr:mechanosensitive ion channel domain-containing protein [Commensalibacter communis]CAI3950114.1 Small-conductance mechanosensitive channel (MscS) (PDB:2OAU) [Commensalibacter communis]
MQSLASMLDWIYSNKIVFSLLSIVLMLLSGFIASIICKYFLLSIVRQFILHRNTNSDDQKKDIRITERLSHIAPVITVYFMSLWIQGLPVGLVEAIHTICAVILIINITILINEMLDITKDAYAKKHGAKSGSIKGYIQIGKIIISSIAVILIIATLSNKSPIIIISSLGAIAAVLMLVFQHTLISLVANIQVSSSNVIRLGDWIEMPVVNISGEVTDIALHTITVRNWDNTISQVPTKNFITETYTNWQPMFESGGRRIKRSFFVDQSSIIFFNDDLLNSLKSCNGEIVNNIKNHIETKMALPQFKNITNLGLYRSFILDYLKNREDICKDMYIVVRQLSPTSEGLPIEIYCFSSNVFWNEYEETQSEIFEFMYATATFFKLGIYQKPSGTDIQKSSSIQANSSVDLN